MKLYAQHGFGEGDRVTVGLTEETIEGVIFSPKDIAATTVDEKAMQIRKAHPDADILVDPQVYVCPHARRPNAKLGRLEEWEYFHPWRRSDLETSETVDAVLDEVFAVMTGLPVTGIIAPNVYISKSFDSIEAAISKDFIQRTRRRYHRAKDKRPVFATLAVSAQALLDTDEFEGFMRDITLLDPAPDGFYVLIGANQDPRSEIFDRDVLSRWMFINYALSVNGFQTINGYSDLVTPFLGIAGGAAGATGWWGNLRTFSLTRFLPESSGGQRPIPRYLSNLLLNRLTFSERMACAEVIPEIDNGLPHDADYEDGAPDGDTEVLQSWESIARLNADLLSGNTKKDLESMASYLKQVRSAYLKLNSEGIRLEGRSSGGHIIPMAEALESFKKSAEI